MSFHTDDPLEETGRANGVHELALIGRARGLYGSGLKRLFDVGVVLIMAVVWLPMVAILAALISLDGASPFYWSERVGRGGRIFRMLKLRTMVPDADKALERHLSRDPGARLEWDRTQKLKCDPRITRLGRLLRKSSLDELPQLWNVLIGDMSLVGPRPMMPNQQKLYRGKAYYFMRPGITGAWQISVRNESEFARRVEYDNAYFAALSFGTDLRILLGTVRVVLSGTGY
ncbi:lipopolysaccharide/colanic/teichoic acid biosynthesis glycosyltransferase [Albidovulum inexpectatum]|uniref:Lipopolysaccharide/colanic/teichoic acid biosynthesis glycosyltransferase n=1 Tax=Albidovulum inexpectatum TaxID=196587 RepID=A0A2S5JE47_9RHOB|nr:sugar transferase [Albidovulum inexpectatum]PPB79658.1 lipopolysaccharide/colanic/teichoic acid biosynthesis glycosyltransferase [Albidovulum inexpectatum]